MLQERESLTKQLQEQREAAADANQRGATLNSQKMQLEREVSVGFLTTLPKRLYAKGLTNSNNSLECLCYTLA